MIRQKNMLAKINCISAGMHCQQWSRWTVRGESRQTKLITETRISTVREQEGGGGGEGWEAFWGKEEWMNEWKHIGHPEFSPSPPLWALTAGCFTALLPRLRWAQIQFSVQITSSASQKKASGVRRSHPPPPSVWTPRWPGAKLTERRGWPWIAPALGAFQLFPPSVHTHIHTTPRP